MTTPILPGATADHPVLIPSNPPAQTPAPTAPPAPQMNTVPQATDPRGEKRGRDEEGSDAIKASEQPRVKRTRTETEQEKQVLALFEAIKLGELERIKMLLSNAPGLRDAIGPDLKGRTPLADAAHRGQVEIVALLLAFGARVDGRTSKGATPLMHAALSGHVEVIKLLCAHGADPNAFVEDVEAYPLRCAFERGHLEACQALVSAGADIFGTYKFKKPQTGKEVAHSVLHQIICRDCVDLVAWLMDTRLLEDYWSDPASGQSVIFIAAKCGASGIVRMLIERGVSPNSSCYDPKIFCRGNVLQIADSCAQFHVVECILKSKMPVDVSGVALNDSTKKVSDDLIAHQSLWLGPTGQSSDGLKLPEIRQRPQNLLYGLVRHDFMFQFIPPCRTHFASTGWSHLFVPPKERRTQYAATAAVLGKNSYPRPLTSNVGVTSKKQQLHVLVEWMSEVCAMHAPFSGIRLSAQTEQVMNQMFDLQRELMLAAIAEIRSEFDALVRKLPATFMNTYITRTNSVNAPDLYRALAETGGLYDPLARAVLRLLKESWAKLQEVQKKPMPAEFAALSEPEQLKHVIAGLLEEWDKIPEIVEALTKGKSTEELEILSDLLFQQWRLFCEAFGVIKPRYSQFGPHRPEGVEPEPGMEVDVPKSELPGSGGVNAPAAMAPQ